MKHESLPEPPTESDEKIARLEKELRKLKSAVEELTVLNELAIAAGSSLEVDQVLDIIVKKSLNAVGAEQGTIMLVTSYRERPLQTLIRQADRSEERFQYKIGPHITGWILKNRQPLIIEDLATDARFKTTREEEAAIRTVLGVPIWSRGKIMGVLVMSNKKNGAAFTENDLRLVSIIAAQSGQLIRNSQLQEESLRKKQLEQELNLARNIQLRLLPREEPHLEGFEIASYFRAAVEVGGDYFDYFSIDDNHLGIAVADASGHGPAAAMLMSMVKGVLHTLSTQFAAPEAILQQMNTTLSEIIPPETFITMMLLTLDSEGLLRFSNAGHNPPFWYNKSNGNGRFLKLPGCALNLTTTPVYRVKEFRLNPGDFLLLYTDGITETMNPQTELFGEERFRQAALAVSAEPAEKIIQHLLDEISSFSHHAPQADDMVLIVLKRTSFG